MIFARSSPARSRRSRRDGGEALLRERVAALDEDQRQLLRGALADVAVGILRLTNGSPSAPRVPVLMRDPG